GGRRPRISRWGTRRRGDCAGGRRTGRRRRCGHGRAGVCGRPPRGWPPRPGPRGRGRRWRPRPNRPPPGGIPARPRIPGPARRLPRRTPLTRSAGAPPVRLRRRGPRLDRPPADPIGRPAPAPHRHPARSHHPALSGRRQVPPRAAGSPCPDIHLGERGRGRRRAGGRRLGVRGAVVGRLWSILRQALRAPVLGRHPARSDALDERRTDAFYPEDVPRRASGAARSRRAGDAGPTPSTASRGRRATRRARRRDCHRERTGDRRSSQRPNGRRLRRRRRHRPAGGEAAHGDRRATGIGAGGRVGDGLPGRGARPGDRSASGDRRQHSTARQPCRADLGGGAGLRPSGSAPPRRRGDRGGDGRRRRGDRAPGTARGGHDARSRHPSVDAAGRRPGALLSVRSAARRPLAATKDGNGHAGLVPCRGGDRRFQLQRRAFERRGGGARRAEGAARLYV
ncbi:MAG: hypothetical protein AVDCRST_MAG19-443, partial [uncultured Thermomicrobiales bacterium]